MDSWILCDLYDTLVDAESVRRCWPDALGALAAARWGGSAAAWAAAQRSVEPQIAAALTEGIVAGGGRGIRQLWHRYFREVLTRAFSLTDVPIPPGLTLAAAGRQLQAEAAAQFCAALPGAVTAVRALHAAGHRLAVAADLPAPLAAGLLAGCDLTSAFAAVLGPDVLGIARVGSEFFRRAFARLRVAPDRCIVFAARPLVRQWAEAAGAAAALSPVAAGWETVPSRVAALTAAWW